MAGVTNALPISAADLKELLCEHVRALQASDRYPGFSLDFDFLTLLGSVEKTHLLGNPDAAELRREGNVEIEAGVGRYEEGATEGVIELLHTASCARPPLEVSSSVWSIAEYPCARTSWRTPSLTPWDLCPHPSRFPASITRREKLEWLYARHNSGNLTLEFILTTAYSITAAKALISTKRYLRKKVPSTRAMCRSTF